MPLVNVQWSYRATDENTREKVAEAIEKALRRSANVKAKIHITFTDTSSETPVINISWTQRPQNIVDAACKAVDEEVKAVIPADTLIYYVFTNIPRGNFGANGVIVNKQPDPTRGFY